MLALHSLRRRHGVLFLLLAALLFTAPGLSDTAEAATRHDKKMRRLINGERIERGVAPLRMKDRLVWIAKAHSRDMAASGGLYHSKNLPERLPWKNVWWGENVGRGSSVTSLHNLFMESDGHRANVLSRKFSRVGIGVVHRDGRTYVTVVFVS